MKNDPDFHDLTGEIRSIFCIGAPADNTNIFHTALAADIHKVNMEELRDEQESTEIEEVLQ